MADEEVIQNLLQDPEFTRKVEELFKSHTCSKPVAKGFGCVIWHLFEAVNEEQVTAIWPLIRLLDSKHQDIIVSCLQRYTGTVQLTLGEPLLKEVAQFCICPGVELRPILGAITRLASACKNGRINHSAFTNFCAEVLIEFSLAQGDGQRIRLFEHISDHICFSINDMPKLPDRVFETSLAAHLADDGVNFYNKKAVVKVLGDVVAQDKQSKEIWGLDKSLIGYFQDLLKEKSVSDKYLLRNSLAPLIKLVTKRVAIIEGLQQQAEKDGDKYIREFCRRCIIFASIKDIERAKLPDINDHYHFAAEEFIAAMKTL